MSNTLSIKNLSISFKDNIKVVNKINLEIPAGKTVAIVGESGSGKTISALSVLKLLPAGAKIENGEIIYKGDDLLKLSDNQIDSFL